MALGLSFGPAGGAARLADLMWLWSRSFLALRSVAVALELDGVEEIILQDGFRESMGALLG
jgi:hypothetical protein